jgi:probable rRNA maturation factor
VLTIESDLDLTPELCQRDLESLAQATLAGEGIGGVYDLNLLITSDAGIAAINRTYRSVAGATDVLSFSMLEGSDSFIAPPNGVLYLGDIVISYERAADQAKGFGHSVRQEVAELFLHGLLHILGYNHETASDAALMADKAETYLKQLQEAET